MILRRKLNYICKRTVRLLGIFEGKERFVEDCELHHRGDSGCTVCNLV